MRTPATQKGFSVIEALIAAVLISVAALGLGNAISRLSQTRTKSQLISIAISTESALVSSLQSPSTYAAYKAVLQAGNVPQGLSIVVPGDDKSFTIVPGQSLYFTRTMDPCNAGSFSDKTCVLMVKLAPMKKIDDHFGFAYSIQGNPSLTPMSALGSPNADDYSVSIPVDIYQAGGNDINCDDKSVDIGMMGMGDDGKPICIRKPTAADTCPVGTLAKGFKVVYDGGSKEYRLTFNCSPPLRILTCVAGAGNPYPGAYALQSFLPVSLDQASAPSTLAYNTCSLIAANPSPYANSGGTAYVMTQRDGVQVPTACPTGYIPQATRCDVSSAAGSDVTCTSGIHLTHVNPTQASPTVTGNSISCQVVVPAQPFCSGSPGDPNFQTKAWADVNLTYQCVLDGSVPETLRATSN